MRGVHDAIGSGLRMTATHIAAWRRWLSGEFRTYLSIPPSCSCSYIRPSSYRSCGHPSRREGRSRKHFNDTRATDIRNCSCSLGEHPYCVAQRFTQHVRPSGIACCGCPVRVLSGILTVVSENFHDIHRNFEKTLKEIPCIELPHVSFTFFPIKCPHSLIDL
jgi:hypothetical protein